MIIIWIVQGTRLISFQINDVDYVAAKKVSANDTRFTFSPQFKQKIAGNFSSVHIPVEIYEGGKVSNLIT
jgi:hypothetical protein